MKLLYEKAVDKMLVKLTPGRISKATAAVHHVEDDPLSNSKTFGFFDVVGVKDVAVLVVVVVEHLKRVELKLYLVLFTFQASL